MPNPRAGALGNLPRVILSDVSIRKALAEGRIIIEPLDGRRRAAVVGRPARRPLLPRLPQRHDAVHRPEARRRRTSPSSSRSATTARSSCTPASSCSARRSSASRSPTISSRGSRGSRRLGRLGLLIHSTAGFVDAGWDGHLTLELSNVANLPIAIYPEMKIGQISFLQMTTAAEHPYGSGAKRGRSTRGSAGRRRAATT